VVYKSTLINEESEKSEEVEVKIFSPVDSDDDSPSYYKDISYGKDIVLRSEYTITYRDIFECEGYLCVSMPLITMSLDEYLQSKKFLSDEVVNFFSLNFKF
jgi:hypothetical protein